MVTVNNLNFSYGKEALFQDLSLELKPGNIYGLLGLNGAGKSTFLKLISGLIYPQSGTCRVLGHDSSKRSPELLSEVFMLPEELYLPGVSAENYVKTLSPFYPKFDRERFEKYMQEFDLPARKLLTKYSYGMKKKFLLSFGLSAGTTLFILDEPTNGLDIPSKGQFRRLVAESITDDRIFIISTHQVRDVEHLIDPVIVVNKGKVLYNNYLDDISDKIVMSQTPTQPEESSSLLYSEPCVGGYWSVWKSTEGGGSKLDLEVLFNMSVSNPGAISGIFNKENA